MVLNLFSFFGNFGGSKPIKIDSVSVSNIKADWQNINLMLKGGQPSQLKQALITADKSLDNALRGVVAGETMGERLKNAKDKYDRDLYDKIWSAHKMRNSMVHESNYEPPYHMIKQGIENLKSALAVLGIYV